MTIVNVNVHSQDGITSEIVGRGKGKITAERTPHFGVPNGMGYGGGEILALAVGACFYNNLRRLANEKGIILKTVEVNVTVETSDDEPMTREIRIKPRVESEASEEEIEALMTQALQQSYVADMLTHNVSVNLA